MSRVPPRTELGNAFAKAFGGAAPEIIDIGVRDHLREVYVDCVYLGERCKVSFRPGSAMLEPAQMFDAISRLADLVKKEL